ncbi:MAG: RNA-binding S4 domain-containing protein [Gammaproteobacteria bacterium]|nr:RNA-binding S4 domain-containing protein [Gammaproteobacteria bacterium]
MSDDGLRLDRWLWFTRFYKTRTAASDAVQGGHVRVNGELGRAATRVRVGDRIRLVRQQLKWEVEVRDIPARRGPASEAQACYQESEESLLRREQTLTELRRDRLQQPTTRGKPDKHTRRLLRDRKGR